MSYIDQLKGIRRKLSQGRGVTITLPKTFAFKDHNVIDFDGVLSLFDWGLKNCKVVIDLRGCTTANYQAISLIVIYSWVLKDQGCTVSIQESGNVLGASGMWRKIGARGSFPVLFSENQQFNGDPLKPLIAVRNNRDFKN